MTYREQETSWKDLKQARNDLQKTGSNFMEALYLKNNQLEGSSVTKKQ